MRNLGLIGGLGPGATIHYYQQLVKAQVGEMLIVHADVERVLSAAARADRAGLATYLARLIERLAAGGAEVAAISAITPHMCLRELKKISPLPIIDAIQVVGAEIRARGFKKVALFGTRFVVESRLFDMLDGVEVLVPEPLQVETIHQAYLEIVNGGTKGRATLTQLAHELPVDAVVLAGTDLASVFDETNTSFAHIDCAQIHINAIAQNLQAP